LARSKQRLKRDRQFNVGLTAPEYDLLLSRAAASGMRPVDYGRARLFGERRGVTFTEPDAGSQIDPLFQTHLSRLGNNLNQIARRLNRLGYPPTDSLEPLLREIRALLAKGRASGS
jgi:hypothetical protein